MRSKKKIKQVVLPVQDDHRHEKCLIWNINTGRLHSPECSAIDMMREDHKIPTYGGAISHHADVAMPVREQVTETGHSNMEDPEGMEICMDKW